MPWRVLAGLVGMSAVCFLVFSLWLQESRRVREVSEETYNQLSHVRIPTADIRPADLDQAIDRLNEAMDASKLRDKRRFARWSEAELPPGFARRIGGWKPQVTTIPFPIPKVKAVPDLPGLDPPPDADEMVARLLAPVVSGEMPPDLSLRETIEYVSRAFNCFVGERGETIFFVCGARPIVEHTYTVPGSNALYRASPGSGDDVSANFKAMGVGLAYEGTGVWLSGDRKVIVRATQEDADLCEAILGHSERDYPWWQRAQWWTMEQWVSLRSRFGGP